MIQNYKIITLCGSTRFKEQFLEAQKRLTLEGYIVISVGLFGHSGDDEVWKPGTKEMLDDMHLRKIDLADEIFVINVGGYIGESTRSEIAYAEKTGKKVTYLEPTSMTEKEKMLAGEIYSAVDPQLLEELVAVKEIIHDYNLLRPSETQKGKEILKGLLGHIADDEILIVQPFYCDYGKQISVGKRFFANFNFTVLDEAPVTIGDDCFIGPNVSIYTACHSTDPVERNSRREWAEPVSIGNNVWIGGSVTILPGVKIGDNVTVGAGSVVTKDIPSNCVAVGNPCQVVKSI